MPAFYDVSYRPDGRVEAITAKEGAPAVVRKAIIQDMNSQPLPENFVVPMIGAVHDRAQIEVLLSLIHIFKAAACAAARISCADALPHMGFENIEPCKNAGGAVLLWLLRGVMV